MIRVVNRRVHTTTEDDIYIGRGSALGNKWTHIPFNTKAEYVVATRHEAITKYEQWLREQLKSTLPSDIKIMMNLIYSKHKYGDVNLVCYCKPLSCHGDIIKKIIEEQYAKNH